MSFLAQVHAQPTIVSTVPASGATAASPSADVVFTFSEAMKTTTTSVMFLDTNGATLTTTSVWSDGDKALTCTPSPAFPSPDEIIWEATGKNASGISLGGVVDGIFFVGGSSGGSTGCITHTNTEFTIDEGWIYNQTGAGSPTLDATDPYTFSAQASLDSNLTVTAVSLTLPNSAVTNLYVAGDSDTFVIGAGTNSQSALETDWPNGNYAFDVQGTSLTDVTFAWNVTTQPGVPHIANFAAAQAVDSTKPFTLQWDAFTNKASTSGIEVDIGYDPCAGTGFESDLPGTATSVVIPAGVLQAATNYTQASLVFVNGVRTTNTSLKYVESSGRSSATVFPVTTLGGAGSSPPSLSGAVWSGTTLTFDVSGTPDKNITIQYSTTLLSNSWTTLLTTNSATGTATITDTPSKAILRRFYRATQ